MATYKGHRILAILGLGLILTTSGCGFDRLLDQIDEAIRQVEITRGAILSDSRNWKKTLLELEDNASEDIRQIISEDLTEFAKSTIKYVGIEARCELDFVDNKILGYLTAVLEALKQIRAKAEAEGKLDQSIEILLSEMIKVNDLIEPWPCQIPANLIFVPKNGRLVLKEDIPVTLGGFGFRRPLNEYFVRLLDLDRHIIDSINGSECLNDISPYELQVYLHKLPLKVEHRFINISWKNNKVTEIAMNTERPEIEKDPSIISFAAFFIYIKHLSDKNKRICVELNLLQNNILLESIPEYGRNIEFKKGQTEEIRFFIKNVDIINPYSIILKFLDLDGKGEVKDRKNVPSDFTGNSIGKMLEGRGYERIGNKYILREFPPTLRGDWNGEISFIIIPNDNHVKKHVFSSMPFEFDNGISTTGVSQGTSEFKQIWGADGTPE